MLHLYSAYKNSLHTTILLERAFHDNQQNFHNFRNRFRGGHRTVRDSLILGLRLLGEDFRVNAEAPNEPAQKVGVLAGTRIARDLIRNGSKVVLGPNYSVSPRQDPEIFANENITTVVVPSEWVKKFYASELPEISQKIVVWPAGIDTDFWRKLHPNSSKKKAIIYDKRQDKDLVAKTVEVLVSAGFVCEVVSYGAYTPSSYRQSLERAGFVVWLGSSESQGLAQFEAWSMGVPTLVRLSATPLEIPLGKVLGQLVLRPGEWSPSPYLSDSTGMFWESFEQLLQICNRYADGQLVFDPRKFVEDNYSVRSAAQNYLSMF